MMHQLQKHTFKNGKECKRKAEAKVEGIQEATGSNVKGIFVQFSHND
jgi:hypothetical protein